MKETKRILSIDGGGIRGIVPAMILAELERKTGKPVSEIFDLIAGTSTGGILALGLVKPGADGRPAFSAEELVALYENEGKHIFSRPVWYRLRAVGNLVEEKYPSDGIDRVLDSYFGRARLSDALTDVIVTAYEIERRMPWFFSSRKARHRVEAEGDFLMSSVARATSAAPTYFEPLKVDRGNRGDYLAFIDGGVFANNPALCAYVEALKMFPDADFVVVSLGTGEQTRRIPYEEAKHWGLAAWAQPVLATMFDGVSDTVDYQMRKLLPRIEETERYYRFQAKLETGSDDMDDTSRTNLRALKLLAEGLLRDNRERMKALCAVLSDARMVAA